METIVNKVAQSGLVTLDLAPWLPAQDSMAVFDLKPFLFREMILREQDYRAALQAYDWSGFRDKHVAVGCSVDAIIPLWAYMLAATALQPVAKSVYFGSAEALKAHLITSAIQSIPQEQYRDKRVVIKGCGDTGVPEAAYVAVTMHLKPVVTSLMYGEPCSTVPVYKKPR